MHAKSALRAALTGLFCGLLGSCVTPGPDYAGPPPVASPIQCGALLPFFVVRGGRAVDRTIYGQQYGNALLFLAGLDIDADGAPNAYNPNDYSGLDALSNAGGPGHWWGLATNRYGDPYIQSASDGFPGFYVSKTSLTDPDVGDASAQRRYVDARKIPFITLPGGKRARDALAAAGMKLGDLAVVYNVRTRKSAAAVWADEGPSGKLGEGSIKLAEELGYTDASPRTGGTSSAENLYVLFPGTSLGFPRPAHKIKEGASDLLALWGGEARLVDCAEQLKRR